MISGLLAIVFLASVLKGTTELQKHLGKQFGAKEPKLLKPEKQPAEQRYFFWNSVQRK